MNDQNEHTRRVIENLTKTVLYNIGEIAILRSQLQEAKRINQEAAHETASFSVMAKFLASRGWKKDPTLRGIWVNDLGKCDGFFGAIIEEIRFNGPAKNPRAGNRRDRRNREAAWTAGIGSGDVEGNRGRFSSVSRRIPFGGFARPIGCGCGMAGQNGEEGLQVCGVCAKIQAAHEASIAAGICQTCNGRGEIGGHSGQTAESYEDRIEPCPECCPEKEPE